ncbi:MAG: aminoacyl-tRNA hydrolase [Actinomycetales bacterium]|nr:aminoacyl-tRNA hydrolase [Actinomycetales bacterium]
MSAHGRFRIPESEVEWHFSRSSGPGGQHVNTSDTRAEIRWNIETSNSLSPHQRETLRQRLNARLVGDELRVVSSTYRSQLRNRESAHSRLEHLVAESLRPVKQRKATRPSRGAQARRRESKTRRSDIKSSRRANNWSAD